MKYTKLFGKTSKAGKVYESKSVEYLFRGAFIDQVMAGGYTFLPLGLRVLQKIEQIVREEMDKIGVELLMPAIVPTEYWKQTGRFDTIDVLFKVVGANKISLERNSAEYVLNPTHEDIIAPTAKKFNLSYKDLPFAVYQIQSKFRNEVRPKTGLLRTREFRMKDLYSFHKDVEDLKRFYEVAREAYMKVYKRLGIGDDTYYTAASGGDFTEDFSHEFQTKLETGEDVVFRVKSNGLCFNKEIAPSLSKAYEQDKEMKEFKDVFGEGIIGVEDLCQFMGIKPYQTTKTLIFESEKGVLVASVRGDYDVNELKLMKVAGVKQLQLATEETVKKVTGAEIGYAGIVNLPKDVMVYIDESVEPLVNFETGGNKTHYHLANVNWGRDLEKPNMFYDIKVAKLGDLYPETKEEYDVFKASEVGNIFPLNTKFTKAVGYYFTDADGSQKEIYMGSYGIGTSRLMGVIAEKFYDDKGILWPANIAPYNVHIVSLGSEGVKEAETLYNELMDGGIEVLWDDRTDVSAGEKFSDADLIGIPVRLVISDRSLQNGGYEFKLRNSKESKIVSKADLKTELAKIS
ncbi:MAG: prolyl-tRNA synthetase [candidate division WS6 bacterium GW2011_GWF2_39_15]|uniref:Proline--tRNA ligase n=1 Tax=candidate division WS6 bacterium GW2011_GWF2_39_15 TaxID=1619100 RepID=A0A0G0Q7H9_9BACT|nr:MAG: prolyl-tRNA synthetase [candidate division WS6 bacterium GW2011_GWF2_39_15]